MVDVFQFQETPRKVCVCSSWNLKKQGMLRLWIWLVRKLANERGNTRGAKWSLWIGTTLFDHRWLASGKTVEVQRIWKQCKVIFATIICSIMFPWNVWLLRIMEEVHRRARFDCLNFSCVECVFGVCSQITIFLFDLSIHSGLRCHTSDKMD